MGSVSGSSRAGVFPEDAVPDPVEPILDLPVAPDKVQELARGGLTGRQAGHPQGRFLAGFSLFLNRVTRSIRKTCSRWGKSEYPLRREETRIVWVSIRPCPEKVIVWGGGKSLVVEAGDLVFEGFPVVLDREDIIASLLPDPGGQGILGMEGVGGDHLAGKVERLQKRMGGRDLVALGTVQAFLGDNGPVLVDERRHETDRGGADRLAVDRDGPAGRMGHNILGQDPVELDGVGLRQDPPDRGFAGRKKALLAGRPPASETPKLALGEVLGPAGDPFVGALSGQNPARPTRRTDR